MCSISIPIDVSELSGSCKNCDSCKHSDICEDGMMVCLVDMKDVYMTSPCNVCVFWKNKVE